MVKTKFSVTITIYFLKLIKIFNGNSSRPLTVPEGFNDNVNQIVAVDQSEAMNFHVVFTESTVAAPVATLLSSATLHYFSFLLAIYSDTTKATVEILLKLAQYRCNLLVIAVLLSNHLISLMCTTE